MMKKQKDSPKPSDQNLTEAQHYVWRAYLKGWTEANYLHYFRRHNGDVRRASPKKVAQDSFFYAAEKLSEGDLQFLNGLISQFRSEQLRELAQGWVTMLQLPFEAAPLLQNLNLPDLIKTQAAADMDSSAKTMTEQLHGKIETAAAPLLKSLRAADISFLENPEKRAEFIIFITNQYFRTQKMRLALPYRRGPVAGHDPLRTALVESLIFATNVGAGLIAEWSRYKAFLLKSDGSVPFITGDQPVINLLGEAGGLTGGDVELYYPLSPSLAFLLTPSQAKFADDVHVIGRMMIETYNLLILQKSERDVFSNDKAYLEEFVKDIREP